MNTCHPAGVWHPCGVLNVGEVGDGFVDQALRSARDFGLTFEAMDSTAISNRWPGWAIDSQQHGCFEPDGGVVFCERALSVWRGMIDAASNVAYHGHAPVAAIGRRGSAWHVHTAGARTYDARRCLLACGKSVVPLVGALGHSMPLQRRRKVFAWFSSDARYDASCFPGFSLTTALGDYYGIPSLEGRGIKIGQHDGGEPVSVDEPLAPFDAMPGDENDLVRLIDAHLPNVGALREGAVCEYICTPDGDFLIDEIEPGLILASGFSGHGFKFAPALGYALATWLSTGLKPAILESFSADRLDNGRV